MEPVKRERSILYLLNNLGWRRATERVGSEHRAELLAIALRLCEQSRRRYSSTIARALLHGRHGSAAVERLVEEQLGWAFGNPDEAHLLFLTAHHLPLHEGTNDELSPELRGALTDWMRPLILRGELPPFDEEDLARLLLGPGQAVIRRWLLGIGANPLSLAPEVSARIRALVWSASRRDGLRT